MIIKVRKWLSLRVVLNGKKHKEDYWGTNNMVFLDLVDGACAQF